MRRIARRRRGTANTARPASPVSWPTMPTLDPWVHNWQTSCFYIQLILKHSRARAGSVKSQGWVSHAWADTIHFACFGRNLPMSLCAFRNAGLVSVADVAPAYLYLWSLRTSQLCIICLALNLGAAFSSTSCAERHTEAGAGVVQFDEALRLCPIQGHESIGKNSFSLDLQTYNTKESTRQRHPLCHFIREPIQKYTKMSVLKKLWEGTWHGPHLRMHGRKFCFSRQSCIYLLCCLSSTNLFEADSTLAKEGMEKDMGHSKDI